jgi:hypothetical protein
MAISVDNIMSGTRSGGKDGRRCRAVPVLKVDTAVPRDMSRSDPPSPPPNPPPSPSRTLEYRDGCGA